MVQHWPRKTMRPLPSAVMMMMMVFGCPPSGGPRTGTIGRKAAQGRRSRLLDYLAALVPLRPRLVLSLFPCPLPLLVFVLLLFLLLLDRPRRLRRRPRPRRKSSNTRRRFSCWRRRFDLVVGFACNFGSAAWTS